MTSPPDQKESARALWHPSADLQDVSTNGTAVHSRHSRLLKRLLNSAPPAGSGLNEWLAKAARMTSDLEPAESFDMLAEVIEAKGGNHDARAVWRAINKIRGTQYNGPSKTKWPELNLKLIERITLNHIWDVPGALSTLESRSPERRLDKLTADQIVRRLFPVSSLLSIGEKMEDTFVHPLEHIKNLHKFSLIVPSPMIATSGLTQENKESGRCLSNTGTRRFLITEFDFKRTKPDGTPSIWVPLLDLWESYGMTAQDAAAAIIQHLAKYGPLVMVVFSGNVSLHAWWITAGWSEEEGSGLNYFMKYAAQLGADTATYTRSQFVRMPGGTRPDGRRQPVHFLDFNKLARKGN
jgi:hypothetical protein